jgi:tetratricopeptide repeat protein 8
MRALTEQLYVDETEVADDGLADMLDENAFHQTPMPGTSMRQPTANPNGGMNGPSPAMRPMTMSGRPITGMVRLNTQSTQGGKSMENVLKTARTAATARPVTTATGRFVRLGTVSQYLKIQLTLSVILKVQAFNYFLGFNVKYT